MEKQCTGCLIVKPIEQFNKASEKSGYKDGHTTRCKDCLKLYKESRKERDKELKHILLKNPEKRERKKELERNRRIEKPVDYIYQQIKGRAARRNIEFNIEKEDIILPERCPLLECSFNFGSKEDYKYSYSVDRIDPKKGYIKGNIKIISSLANTMKNCASKEELLNFAKNIENYLKNNDIV